MAKFFGNLHLVLLTGVVLALIVMFRFAGISEGTLPVNAASITLERASEDDAPERRATDAGDIAIFTPPGGVAWRVHATP